MNTAGVSESPGGWLRGQRIAAGLTQEDLAERSGVSVRTIADMERGRTRRPYPSSVRALIRALGLPDATGAELVVRYRSAGDEPPSAAAPPGSGTTEVPAEPAEPAVPRQLPTAVPYFAGRTSELRLLDAMLGDAGRESAGVVISAIGGTAGVGKTALALNWAHRVAPNFPDGQLYANLRGFDPAGSPADPADVLRGFLDALQVHPERFPGTTEGLAALYRSLLADRKMLVLLDNAADVAQVRPLLPASPACLVIVTSRRELSALAAGEGARLLSLDVLPEQEAIELLTARLGTDRADAEPEGFAAKPFALAWLRAEYQVLLKIVDLAAREGFDDHAWRLPVVLWTFFDVCGHWHDGTRIHRTALEAARRRGDQFGQAHALRGLGTFEVMLGDYAQAQRCLAEAQELFRRLGDTHGLARTDLIMGQAFEFQGRQAEALLVVKEALRLSETARDDPYMQLVRASALNGSAWYSAHLGDLGQARAHCTQAIELCQSIGYSPGEAGTWDTLGFVWQRLGDHAEATACFLRAVALEREMGSRFNLAMALAHLDDTHVSTGDLRAARLVWAEALTILADLHHPEAFEVRAKLESLNPITL